MSMHGELILLLVCALVSDFCDVLSVLLMRGRGLRQRRWPQQLHRPWPTCTTTMRLNFMAQTFGRTAPRSCDSWPTRRSSLTHGWGRRRVMRPRSCNSMRMDMRKRRSTQLCSGISRQLLKSLGALWRPTDARPGASRIGARMASQHGPSMHDHRLQWACTKPRALLPHELYCAGSLQPWVRSTPPPCVHARSLSCSWTESLGCRFTHVVFTSAGVAHHGAALERESAAATAGGTGSLGGPGHSTPTRRRWDRLIAMQAIEVLCCSTAFGRIVL
mmetsp:Transcript_73369/g.185255  ORF Transcript_73369/g.185255 Transcript_73369/m.185255 type:complete len:274 (+) Transcript_73369:709-1530(+)